MAVLWLAAAGCDAKKADEPKADAAAKSPPPAKAVPNEPLHNPHETASAMEAQKPMIRSQQGSFDLSIDGKTQHMPILPFGENAAVHFEGKKGRITVAGTADSGYPNFRAEMVGWRLDQLELPITLTGNDKQIVRFRYRASERGEYKSDDEATRRGENKVTLESYEGKILTGTFEGTVAPKTETVGDPIKVSGKFKTSLRLKGVKPSTAAEGGAQDEAPDGKAHDAKAHDGKAPDSKAP